MLVSSIVLFPGPVVCPAGRRPPILFSDLPPVYVIMYCVFCISNNTERLFYIVLRKHSFVPSSFTAMPLLITINFKIKFTRIRCFQITNYLKISMKFINCICIAVGSRRLIHPDALQPKAYCTNPGL